MKTQQLALIISLLTFFAAGNLTAQQPTIDSLKIIPTYPTTYDIVKVIIYTSSAYTPCNLDTISFDIIGNQIFVSASPEIGIGPAICNSIDTITIGILNAATYDLICDLGTDVPPVQYDIDTIPFTVTQTIGPTIDSLTIIPTNPTTNDTVKVIGHTNFLTGTCFLIGSSINFNNETITVGVSHYIGGWPGICNSIDTLTIGKLNAASYELHYLLSDTLGPTTHDIDTIMFTVQQLNKLQLTDNSDEILKIYPNPTTTELNIDLNTLLTNKYQFDFYSVLGQKIKTVNTDEDSVSIDISNFKDGVYFIAITDGHGKRWMRKVIKKAS